MAKERPPPPQAHSTMAVFQRMGRSPFPVVSGAAHALSVSDRGSIKPHRADELAWKSDMRRVKSLVNFQNENSMSRFPAAHLQN